MPDSSHTPPDDSPPTGGRAGVFFSKGCDLAGGWARQPQWRILETNFGFGLNFLTIWQAWRADPLRPAMLHFVAAQPQLLNAAELEQVVTIAPDLAPLVQALQRQWWGLLPGVHRLRFDGGQVLLTLHVGDVRTLLRGQSLTVDAICLHNPNAVAGRHTWDRHTFKALARCCRRGTTLLSESNEPPVRDALAQCGFDIADTPGTAHQHAHLHGTFNPQWEPRGIRNPSASTAPVTPGDCLVIGAGIAGASAAASLARRGWRVRVLDEACNPAAGASGLPAGVFAPHISPDDSLLSRLSRSGVRTTMQQADWLLKEGVDWSPCGVLERRIDNSEGLPRHWAQGPGDEWSQAATPSALAEAGLPPATPACWHHKAGWIRPARLVAVLLKHPRIEWQGVSAVAKLRRVQGPTAQDGIANFVWQALDAKEQVLAEAPTVVIAAGAASAPLLEHRWPLQPVRGQISWGTLTDPVTPPAPFPVNGHGNLVPRFTLHDTAEGPSGWVMGSTFERDVAELPPTHADVRAAHSSNWEQLQTLLPSAAKRLEAPFAHAVAPSSHEPAVTNTCMDPAAVRSWSAVRCTSPDRLPIVGPVDAAVLPGLWVCTAMGSRGLTLALLCGELLAARVQGEPLPVDAKLAAALGTERL